MTHEVKKFKQDSLASNLSEDQFNAIAAVTDTTDNILIHGPGGTGKSYILNIIKNLLKEAKQKFVICAPTGIAASSIGGATLHSTFHLPFSGSVDERAAFNSSKLRSLVDGLKVIIIDEISMVSNEVFENVSTVCQTILEDDAVFANIRLIVLGDFYQLPPVKLHDNRIEYVFDSDVFKQCKFKLCELKTNHRQAEDRIFFDLLMKLRINISYSNEELILLQERIKKPVDKSSVIHLYSTNNKVDTHNITELMKLPGQMKTFTAIETGNTNLLKDLLVPKILNLKIGARVMTLINRPEGNFYNGNIGTVKEITDSKDIIIDLDNGFTITVEKHTFEINPFGFLPLATRTQYPLRLAYAASIHKSQGQTFDGGYVSVENMFAPHMAYVMMSRFRNLNNVYMDGIPTPNVDKNVTTFLQQFNVNS